MRKGQSSFELLLIVAFLLLIFGGILYVIRAKTVETNEELVEEGARNVAQTIEEEIKIAKGVGDGYTREFDIPYDISDKEYEVRLIKDRELVVRVDDQEHVVFIPEDVVGTVQKGKNLIEKIDGIVYIRGIDIGIGGDYYFKDSLGRNVAVVRNDGSVIISGELYPNEVFVPTVDDEFIIKSLDNTRTVFALNLRTGDLYLDGELKNGQTEINRDNGIINFIDDYGNIAVKISDDGNLYIRKFLLRNGNP